MEIFQKLDFERIGVLISAAKRRVVLCIPGFNDDVGTAVIGAHKRLGATRVQVVVAAIEAEQALVAANRELITRFKKKIQATLARVWGENSPGQAAA